MSEHYEKNLHTVARELLAALDIHEVSPTDRHHDAVTELVDVIEFAAYSNRDWHNAEPAVLDRLEVFDPVRVIHGEHAGECGVIVSQTYTHSSHKYEVTIKLDSTHDNYVTLVKLDRSEVERAK